MITIYHNTRCTKSRTALQILDEQGVPYTVKLYMEKPLTRKQLESLLKKLKLQPSELLRTGEDIYKALSTQARTEEEWLNLMLEHPQLIERPIVVNGRKAIIARPPEMVLDIL